MVKTVSPNASETPTSPIEPGTSAPAASTAAPQRPTTSQKVPKASAASRRAAAIGRGLGASVTVTAFSADEREKGGQSGKE
ncbi:putative membrane protein [Sphingomonas sp. BK345]|nr:putative membrane protein [Sphingomonas sp. BK345]